MIDFQNYFNKIHPHTTPWAKEVPRWQVFDIRKIKDVVIKKIGTLLFSELQKYFPFEDLRIMFKILTISLENLQLLEPISRTGL